MHQFAVDFKNVMLHDKVKSVLTTIKITDDIYEILHFKKVKGNDKAYRTGIGF